MEAQATANVPVSESFRMGMREAHAVLVKGSLHTMLNRDQVQRTARVFAGADAQEIAQWLDDASGPVNASQNPSAMSHPVNAQMARIGVLLITVLVRELHLSPASGALDARRNALAVADGLCAWIDSGGARGESAQIAQLMAGSSPVEAAAIRLGALVRYSCALGLADRLLDPLVRQRYGAAESDGDFSNTTTDVSHAGVH